MDEEKGRLFEEAALPYIDAVYGFGLLLTGRPDEAEDLVQETFLRAFRFFHQYEHGTNCKAWLFTIMKHTFLNQSTQRARLVLSRDVDLNEEGEFQSLGRDAMGRSPASCLRDEVFAKDIEKALALLPETFRLVVVLKDMEGFSYGEIARLLECPIGTVMSRLSRARELLRRFLQDYGVQGSGSHALRPKNLTRSPL